MKTSLYDGIKELMQERNKPATDALRTRIGLFLDIQNPVYWSINYGKTASRSFENTVVSTEILIHIKMLSGCHIIFNIFSMYGNCRGILQSLPLVPYATYVLCQLNRGNIRRFSDENPETIIKEILRYRDHLARKMSLMVTNDKLSQKNSIWGLSCLHCMGCCWPYGMCLGRSSEGLSTGICNVIVELGFDLVLVLSRNDVVQGSCMQGMTVLISKNQVTAQEISQKAATRDVFRFMHLPSITYIAPELNSSIICNSTKVDINILYGYILSLNLF